MGPSPQGSGILEVLRCQGEKEEITVTLRVKPSLVFSVPLALKLGPLGLHAAQNCLPQWKELASADERWGDTGLGTPGAPKQLEQVGRRDQNNQTSDGVSQRPGSATWSQTRSTPNIFYYPCKPQSHILVFLLFLSLWGPALFSCALRRGILPHH